MGLISTIRRLLMLASTEAERQDADTENFARDATELAGAAIETADRLANKIDHVVETAERDGVDPLAMFVHNVKRARFQEKIKRGEME